MLILGDKRATLVGDADSRGGYASVKVGSLRTLAATLTKNKVFFFFKDRTSINKQTLELGQ